MRYLFSAVERVQLLNILPAEGDITTLRIVRNLRSELSFSEEEHAALKFRNAGEQMPDGSGVVPPGQVWFDRSKDTPQEIEIGERAHKVITAAIVRLSETGKLPLDYLELYDRFAGEPLEVVSRARTL